MSFYIALTGLKAAQADLTVTSNNVANVSSTGFKKSRASFGDVYASSAGALGGQGVRLQGTEQQFTQGTLQATDKTLDLAISGEGFFTVKSVGTSETISYTRAGAFGIDKDRYVVDQTGARLQVLPDADQDGLPDGTAAADLTDLVIPTAHPTDPTQQLSSVKVSDTGLVSATFADGSVVNLGVLAMANFPAQTGLRQTGDAHWAATNVSGAATYGAGNNGQYGAVRSGTLERANVDITEELVSLISAQRNFQANSKAIEASNTLTTTIVNLRS
jgi:flagellar hook protein FlgE